MFTSNMAHLVRAALRAVGEFESEKALVAATLVGVDDSSPQLKFLVHYSIPVYAGGARGVTHSLVYLSFEDGEWIARYR